jgi:hypothetical protein
MLGERKQETMGSGYTWIDVQNGVGEKFGENSSYPLEHDEMLLTLPHVSGGRK